MGRPEKIMVVDDEPDTVAFLSAWLEDRGYRACSQRDAREVVEAVLRERPDLLLLDVNMPGQSGIQTYRELREFEALRDLPVIFVTGAAEFALFGGDCAPLPQPAARIEKPIDLDALQRAITRALDGRARCAAGAGEPQES